MYMHYYLLEVIYVGLMQFFFLILFKFRLHFVCRGLHFAVPFVSCFMLKNPWCVTLDLSSTLANGIFLAQLFFLFICTGALCFDNAANVFTLSESSCELRQTLLCDGYVCHYIQSAPAAHIHMNTSTHTYRNRESKRERERDTVRIRNTNWKTIKTR